MNKQRKHPNKHIRAAIKYAVSKGWTLRKGGGHAFVIIFCPARSRSGHQMSVWSTPRNPEAHARDIIAYVDECDHTGPEDTAQRDVEQLGSEETTS